MGVDVYREEHKHEYEQISGEAVSGAELEAQERWKPGAKKDAVEVEVMVREERTEPVTLLSWMMLIWLSVIIGAFLKGGPMLSVDFEAACGSTRWWLALGLPMIPCIISLLITLQHVIAKTRTKREIGYEFEPTDMKWDSWYSLRWPLGCTLAGVASGALGLGGGAVTSPLML